MNNNILVYSFSFLVLLNTSGCGCKCPRPSILGVPPMKIGMGRSDEFNLPLDEDSKTYASDFLRDCQPDIDCDTPMPSGTDCALNVLTTSVDVNDESPYAGMLQEKCKAFPVTIYDLRYEKEAPRGVPGFVIGKFVYAIIPISTKESGTAPRLLIFQDYVPLPTK